MFKKRKSRVDYYHLPLTEHIHDYLVDTGLPNALVHNTAEGAVPPSSDVQIHEEQESDLRMDRVAVFLPLLAEHARASARVVVAEQVQQMPESVREQLPEAYLDAATASMAEIIVRTSAASLSQLMDLGLVIRGNQKTIANRIKETK